MSKSTEITPIQLRDRITGLERMRGSEILPHPRNWRTHSTEQASALAAVLASIGISGAVLAYRSQRNGGRVTAIDGHLRTKNWQDAEWPVLMTDLNDDEADYLITVYDPISLMAGIDAQALASLAQQFADRREVIEILDGLTDIEALLGLGEEQPDGGGDEGEDADTETLHQQLQAKWGTELDQVWEIPSKSAPGQVHRVVCGDSMDAKNIRTACGGQPARCMWSDPPYGVNYEGKTQDALTIENDGAEDLPDLLRRAFAVADASLQDGSAIYIAHPAGQLSITFGLAFLEAGWHLHETLVWVKDSMVLGHSDYHYKHEPIHYGWKGKNRRWYGERDKVSVFEIPRPKRSTLHPTMKPPELIVPQLRNSTKMLDLVLDPFLGSGSTIVACEQSGRVGCGTELDPKYVAVILERLQGLGLEPRLVNG